MFQHLSGFCFKLPPLLVPPAASGEVAWSSRGRMAGVKVRRAPGMIDVECSHGCILLNSHDQWRERGIGYRNGEVSKRGFETGTDPFLTAGPGVASLLACHVPHGSMLPAGVTTS